MIICSIKRESSIALWAWDSMSRKASFCFEKAARFPCWASIMKNRKERKSIFMWNIKREGNNFRQSLKKKISSQFEFCDCLLLLLRDRSNYHMSSYKALFSHFRRKITFFHPFIWKTISLIFSFTNVRSPLLLKKYCK